MRASVVRDAGGFNAGRWIVPTTLPIGLRFFRNEAVSNWELVMAGSSLTTAPLVLVFLLFQRQIIKGIALTGLKG